MKTKDLVSVWNAPDNSRLTPKQMSIRLPLHVAAKLSALCEMFPKKTKTEIIGDLLATALDDVAEGLSNDPYPEEQGRVFPDEDACGVRGRYYELANKFLKSLETEVEDSEDREVAVESEQGVASAASKGVRRKREVKTAGRRRGK